MVYCLFYFKQKILGTTMSVYHEIFKHNKGFFRSDHSLPSGSGKEGQTNAIKFLYFLFF